jgi:hypothetical protein
MRKILAWSRSRADRGIVVGMLVGVTIGEIIKAVM